MTSFPIVLGFTEADHWRPGIGDPTAIGWVTVAAYGIAAVLCFQSALKTRRARDEGALFLFWTILGCIMLILGINKQLDLQTWFTLTGKKLAQSEGWYNYRRPVQLGFIIFIAIAGMLGFFGMWRLVQRLQRLQRHGNELMMPLFGLFLVICFVIIRAASFHHVDQFLKYDIGGVRMNWVLELGGIAVVAIGTALPLLRTGAREDREQ